MVEFFMSNLQKDYPNLLEILMVHFRKEFEKIEVY